MSSPDLPCKRVKHTESISETECPASDVSPSCSTLMISTNPNANVKRVSLRGPRNSPYEGAIFNVDLIVTTTDIVEQATWRSPIYHPVFRLNALLCNCIVGSNRSVQQLEQACQAKLANAGDHQACLQCVLDPTAWAEARTDRAFFHRKAKVRTPGTLPMTDEELRGIETGRMTSGLDLSHLLQTGQYHDVKIKSRGKTFKAHRTILSVRSPALRNAFATRVDNGLLRWDQGSQAVAIVLMYLYCGRPPRHSTAMDVLCDVHTLANELGLEYLSAYTQAAIQCMQRVQQALQLSVESSA
eukprot:TRINITY_DN11619_c0_g3_i2.p1 TRINITY_DN11619_c0_g3~~TRINITY_DN11619_c0_g3_i2.p1  ORF type:complete len:299 (+),score=27.92 TRINITY_DN11619_c0_g3_i2:99-995(+)